MYYLFFSINILHMDCWIMMLFSYTVVDFLFIIKMRMLICKYAPFWQEVSVMSDTQVPEKACGPLVVDCVLNLIL